MNDIFGICLLLEELAGRGVHETVVLNEKLLRFSFATALIRFFSIGSGVHFPSLEYNSSDPLLCRSPSKYFFDFLRPRQETP
jgi:hypothetical protein